jgi:hypothetical protein
VVDEVNKDITGWKVGQRVAVGWYGGVSPFLSGSTDENGAAAEATAGAKVMSDHRAC